MDDSSLFAMNRTDGKTTRLARWRSSRWMMSGAETAATVRNAAGLSQAITGVDG